MHRLWSGNDPVRLAMLQSELESKDIRFVVRNENLRTAVGEIPPIEAWPEIWIVDDADLDAAKTILADLDTFGEL